MRTMTEEKHEETCKLSQTSVSDPLRLVNEASLKQFEQTAVSFITCSARGTRFKMSPNPCYMNQKETCHIQLCEVIFSGTEELWFTKKVLELVCQTIPTDSTTFLSDFQLQHIHKQYTSPTPAKIAVTPQP